MKYDVLESSLLRGIQHVDVPVFFFTGRYDFTTPHELVELYYEHIDAPEKGLVWFENSAHFPFFEEPEAFAEHMVAVRDATLHVAEE